MKPIKPRPWKFVKFNWTRLIVAPSKERRYRVKRTGWKARIRPRGGFQLEKEENVGYGRRLSRVKTSIRNGRNPLTSGRGNSLYRCGERRSSRAAGIRGSLKKREVAKRTILSKTSRLSKRKIVHQFVQRYFAFFFRFSNKLLYPRLKPRNKLGGELLINGEFTSANELILLN